MTKIYLVRHAQAEGNLYRRAHGMYDSLVTPQGYAQIEALRRRFADIPVDAVYSSPLLRTRTTAAAIYEPKHIPLRVLNDLHEVNCGPWEDRTWGDIRYTDPEQLENFNYHFDRWHVNGAESAEDVRERMLGALHTIVLEQEGKTVAAVSHGMASRILLGTLRGMSLKEISERFPHGDNTAVSLIEYEKGEFRVAFANDTAHLNDDLSTFAGQSWWKGKDWKDIGLRFVPLDIESSAGAALYQLCRAEGWLSSHGTMDRYDGAAFYAQARANQAAYAEAVMAAYCEDTFAGLLQLDTEQDKAEDAGRVPFVYMAPGYRKQGAGVQLIGEAVSRYRRLGRRKLRLRCAAENEIAQNFYRRIGFHKIGTDSAAPVNLDLLELDIV